MTLTQAKSILQDPRQIYRIVTASFLHLSHAHICSNMLFLASIGSKIEKCVGSLRFAVLVCFLVVSVGVYEISVLLFLNAVAAMLGIQDVATNQSDIERSPFETIARQQVSVGQFSLGFSGVLFALDVVGTQILDGSSMLEFPLPISKEKWKSVQNCMHQLGLNKYSAKFCFADKETAKPIFRIPAQWSPWVHIIISQCSDPARVSFVGHFSGALAGMHFQDTSNQTICIWPALFWFCLLLPLNSCVWFSVSNCPFALIYF